MLALRSSSAYNSLLHLAGVRRALGLHRALQVPMIMRHTLLRTRLRSTEAQARPSQTTGYLLSPRHNLDTATLKISGARTSSQAHRLFTCVSSSQNFPFFSPFITSHHPCGASLVFPFFPFSRTRFPLVSSIQSPFFPAQIFRGSHPLSSLQDADDNQIPADLPRRFEGGPHSSYRAAEEICF